jgi:hypothetical protein
MKILILSPLFPPDTGAPADYVKELATRLSKDAHVNVLVYGYLPEHISGVEVTSIDKRKALPLRLLRYTLSLMRSYTQHDLIIINNAPSIELPFLFVSLFMKRTNILIESDPLAREHRTQRLYSFLHHLAQKRVQKTITINTETSYKKAEVLPFEIFDEQREAARGAWWTAHINEITT